MGVERKVYSFRLTEEVAEKIRKYGQMENRNFANMIETILINYVAEREKESWPPAFRQAGQVFRALKSSENLLIENERDPW